MATMNRAVIEATLAVGLFLRPAYVGGGTYRDPAKL